MSIVKKLKSLKSNIFGGKGNTGITRPPASTVQDFELQASPTGLLEIDPLGFNTFSYPLDTQVNYENGHYMLFYVNVQEKSKYTYDNYISKKTYDTIIKGESENEQRYKRLRDLKRKVYKGTDNPNAGQGDTSIGVVEGVPQLGIPDSRAYGQTKKGVSSNFNNTRRICDSVSLYLPPNVEESTSAGYNEAATGIAGFLVSSFGKGLANMDASALTRKLGNSMEGILKDMTFRAVGMAGELLGAEGVEALAKKAFGEADNPYMEVLFDRMQLRTFTYNFEFAPRNEDEAIEIQKIIQLFRFHMAPELQGAQSRFLTLPSEFDIHYMYISKDGTNSENDYFNRISTCVLENVTVDYTPGGVKTFADGSPTQINMGLTFKETETLTKEKVNAGY